MYDMYPDSWTEAQAARPQRSASPRPRRRTRKEHSVVPAVIAHQLQTAKDSTADS
jgi:hypothetical protein